MTVATHTAPESLRRAIREAGARGRALVTSIDGRVAILLRVSVTDTIEAQQEALRRVVEALESAGIEVAS